MDPEKDPKAKHRPMTKYQIVAKISDKQGIPKIQVRAILDDFTEIIRRELLKGSAIITDIARFRLVLKPAKPERQGYNPYKKEVVTYKARPAHYVIKTTLMQNLKSCVSGPLQVPGEDGPEDGA